MKKTEREMYRELFVDMAEAFERMAREAIRLSERFEEAYVRIDALTREDGISHPIV